VNEKQLAANRQAMEEVLAATFAQPGSGKLDLNGASKETLSARLRDPLAAAGVPMSEAQLQTAVTDILWLARSCHSAARGSRSAHRMLFPTQADK